MQRSLSVILFGAQTTHSVGALTICLDGVPWFMYPMPVPQAITCCICGGKYFKASLPHHQKVCAQRHNVPTTNCSYCGVLVPKPDEAVHLATRCPNAPPAPERSSGSIGGSPYPSENEQGLDGRVACCVCGRRFARDRIAKHEGICQASSRRTRPTFNSALQRQTEDMSVFGSPGGLPGNRTRAKSTFTNANGRYQSKAAKQAPSSSSNVVPGNLPHSEDRDIAAPRNGSDGPCALQHHINSESDVISGSASRKTTATAGKATLPPRLPTKTERLRHSKPNILPSGSRGGPTVVASNGPKPKIIPSNVTSPDNPLLSWDMG